MLVNVNNIVKRGYKLSDCVLYNGSKYKIVAIDVRFDGEDSKIFLLNGHDPRCYDITSEEGDLYSFVLYDSDETLDRKYSLWVSCEQISKVEDENKNASKEICFNKYKPSDFNKYQPSDFENIDDKRAIEKLLTIRENMSCSEFECSVCPLSLSNDGCAVDFGERYAKERLDAIIEMYEIYHFGRNNE